MKSFLVQTPKFVQRMFPKRIWAFPNDEQNIYLTFDDGPIPEVTPWVLDLLKKHQAKATFFCIGDNVKKHPEIFDRMVREGHAIGNHTFHHLNGRKTNHKDYLANVAKAQEVLENRISNYTPGVITSEVTKDCLHPILFRPPYGQLTASQARAIQQKGYKIVMWNVLSMDYDQKTSEESCFENVAKNLDPGSVVVFHDSLKAKKNMQYTLPKILDIIDKKTLHCSSIH